MAKKNKQELFLYNKPDFHRQVVVKSEEEQFSTLGRSYFWRDYARLIHSPSFRRLKGKTQLFPGYDSDFFRCRLTHSIEVGQIGKSIANSLNRKIEEQFPPTDYILNHFNSFINPDLIEFACYAHDLGHPPFGHQGEAELDLLMLEHGGFEGNAQTLRIISKIEKKYLGLSDKNEIISSNGFNQEGIDKRHGLSLTYRSLASIIKYDSLIKKDRSSFYQDKEKRNLNSEYELSKGYYYTEESLVKDIKKKIAGDENYHNFKTIECSIMDIADDIAYSIYDLEDAFKAGFTNPYDLFSASNEILERVVKVINEKGKKEGFELFESCTITDIKNIIWERLDLDEIRKRVGTSHVDINQGSISLAKNGYARNGWTTGYVSDLIKKATLDTSNKIPALWKVGIDEETLLHIEVLKRLTYHFQISSPKLKVIEFRGRGIVRDIFNVLIKDEKKGIKGFEFMPEDYASMYLSAKENKEDPSLKYRIICDFISGMTDNYALEYRNRLYSSSLSSIHKQF